MLTKTTSLHDLSNDKPSSQAINRENSSTVLTPVPSDRPPLPAKPVRPLGDGQASSQQSMLGNRENSTLALNRLINLNQTPEQAAIASAIPPKAAKLMGDEIFSPVALGK